MAALETEAMAAQLKQTSLRSTQGGSQHNLTRNKVRERAKKTVDIDDPKQPKTKVA